MSLDNLPHAQDAIFGTRFLIAAVNPETGCQRVNLTQGNIIRPFIELRNAGFGWHDAEGRRWKVETVDGKPHWTQA